MNAKLFQLWCLMSVAILLLCLSLVIGFIVIKGAPTLGLSLYFGDTPMLEAILGLAPIWDGIWPACIGTISVVLGAISLAIVPGIATGIWLTYAKASIFKQALELSVVILAGVPSILMGLFGFTLIVLLRNTIAPSANSSLLLSSLCLAMLIIPYLSVTTRTALQALPKSLSICASALGMTPWQQQRYVLLPQAKKGIVSGVMLSIGRAAEDTAVIMLTGAVANAGLPGGIFERYEALPFTIFYFSSQYQSQTELNMAFGAALSLLCFTTIIFSSASAMARR
ncbi:ABC transporter permease subunit [Shewanella maritima]|uniref:ABC transporter permease subunit n=1 Tax=Shewanella maritima TaxID=2520507 RepID=A0A411PJC8_9GAMM|nr:ABC transporter permease subunit [Shewanella maritima]QBF83687.1 ABC transporter permease subunit [Shewanella maritima]